MRKKTITSTNRFFFLCVVLVIMVTGTVFGQISDLALDPSDIRFEQVYSDDTIIGYNLFVRKRPGIESVMLTEPSGYHALRSMEWNPINGSERRELSGVPLFGAYSRYSILSSTPIRDMMFGSAFQLFIPLRVVYGNQSSSVGTAFLHTDNGVRINIRTFDHQYADPNTGRFQNNLTLINTQSFYPIREVPPPPLMAQPPNRDFSTLRYELRLIINNKEVLDRMSDDELVIFLKETFRERADGQQ